MIFRRARVHGRLSDAHRDGDVSEPAETILVMKLVDLEQAQTRLAELDRERAALARQIAAMRSATGGPDIGTAEGRVALFQSLFRGRADVFATRWESAHE